MSGSVKPRCSLSAACALAIGLFTSAAQAVVIYIDDDAPPNGDGLTWNTAFRFLQDALAFANVPANDVDEIRIAQGAYTPDRDESHPAGTGDRAVSFVPPKSIPLMGGFAGIGAIDPDENDPSLYESVVSGDLAGDDQPGFVNSGENSYHVIRASGGGALELEGLVISGGRADGPYVIGFPNDHSLGAGVILQRTGLTMRHCEMRSNFAARRGAGIFVEYQTMTIEDCSFHDNSAPSASALVISEGSAFIERCNISHNVGNAVLAFDDYLSVIDSDFEDNASNGLAGAICASWGIVVNCRFSNNSADTGGALSINSSSFSVSNCEFEGNSAEHGGAADVYGSPHIDGCTFTGNHASQNGGAIRIWAGAPTIDDCHFEDNTAEMFGGAASNYSYNEDDNYEYAAPTYTRCVFLNNQALAGGAMYNRGAKTTVVNCRIESNSATDRGGAMFNVGSYYYDTNDKHATLVKGKVRIFNSLMVSNVAAKGGAASSKFTTMTVANCVVMNNQASKTGGFQTDERSEVRIYNSIIRENSGGLFGGPGVRDVRYSNVMGLAGGHGNIDVDPMFIDPANGDFHLGVGSPCIDSGRNAYLPGTIVVDLDGLTRLVDDPNMADTGVGAPAVIDMGACEHQ